LLYFALFSAVFGYAVTIIPRVYTYYISTALFAIFGLKMLKEGYSMSPNEGQEEFEEVQLDLRKRDDEVKLLTMQLQICH
jgi:Ca2+/H+ antiporter, TMEM165/GDT1 family